jgi:hypothetical protein
MSLNAPAINRMQVNARRLVACFLEIPDIDESPACTFEEIVSLRKVSFSRSLSLLIVPDMIRTPMPQQLAEYPIWF